MSLSNF